MDFPGWRLLLITAIMLPLSVCARNESAAILPIELKPSRDAAVALGKDLFSDPLFSKNNSSSCASCHSINDAGIDGLPRYRGINNEAGSLNTPTVLNASLNTRQFWDGRAPDIAAVITDHIRDRTIFDNRWPVVIERIKNQASLSKQFDAAYNGVIDQKSVEAALTAYVDSLLTPDSPFDRYLKGDEAALSPAALKGYKLFVQYGCMTCHQGPNLGGNLYQKMGIYGDYFKAKGGLTQADLGRFNVTGREVDRYVFKVPGLRNVTLTGPYMHDGSVATLEEVIALMGVYEIGQPIPSFDVPYIITFLESLNGPQVQTTTKAQPLPPKPVLPIVPPEAPAPAPPEAPAPAPPEAPAPAPPEAPASVPTLPQAVEP